MSGFPIEVSTSPQVDAPGQKAVVTSLVPGAGANPFEYAEVNKVRHSTGIIPGKAWITIRNTSGKDQNTSSDAANAQAGSGDHITLQTQGVLAPTSLKWWSRIKITVNGLCIFVGALMKRSDQVGQEALTLEYWDDRWLLSKIPVRGAYVYDGYDGFVKFLPRYSVEVNPGSYKNMTRIPGGNGFTLADVYVFSELAERGTQTLCSDVAADPDANAVAGQSIAATPERLIKYFLYASTQPAPSPVNGGTTSPFVKNWTTLDSTKLFWAPAVAQFPSSSTMKNNMPQKSFKGESMLRAIVNTLEIGGDYRLGVEYQDSGKTCIKFYPTDAKTALTNPDGTMRNGRVIYLQRTGAATDIKTQFDGVEHSDASEMATGVLAEGAPIKIESEFRYSKGRFANDTCALPWTTAEQGAFLMMIQTGYMVQMISNAPNGTPDGTFSYVQGALMPGAVTTSNVVPAKNTNGGLPKSSFANTSMAVNLARLSFPKVFRALQLRADDGGAAITLIMRGLNGSLAAFPFLIDFRTPLNEQLQPYFESDGVKRGRLRIPVRVQVSDIDVSNTTATAKYHDCVFNNGLRITDDGLIWFDGQTDDVTLVDSIYSQTLQLYQGALDSNGNPTDLPYMKYIKINMAVPHDVRLSSSQDLSTDGYDPNNLYDQVDETLLTGNGISLCHYILNPEGFTQEQQVNSSPAADGSFQTSDGGSPPQLTTLTTPCNRIIYDDSLQIAAHVKRQGKDHINIKRTGTRKFPGIRLDLQVGDFIEKIQFVNAGGNVGEWKVNKPVDALEFDFEHQATIMETE